MELFSFVRVKTYIYPEGKDCGKAKIAFNDKIKTFRNLRLEGHIPI